MLLLKYWAIIIRSYQGSVCGNDTRKYFRIYPWSTRFQDWILAAVLGEGMQFSGELIECKDCNCKVISFHFSATFNHPTSTFIRTTSDIYPLTGNETQDQIAFLIFLFVRLRVPTLIWSEWKSRHRQTIFLFTFASVPTSDLRPCCYLLPTAIRTWWRPVIIDILAARIERAASSKNDMKRIIWTNAM